MNTLSENLPPDAAKFKAIREHLELSQEEFATGLDLSREMISRMENGKAEVSKKTKTLLQSVYQIKFDEFDSSNVSDEPGKYITVTDRVDAHDALLSVLVSKVAVLQNLLTHEPVDHIVKSIYKAAEDVNGLEG